MSHKRIFQIKNGVHNNQVYKSGRCRFCKNGFEIGQWVLKRSNGEANLADNGVRLVHIECLVDAHGKPIYNRNDLKCR